MVIRWALDTNTLSETTKERPHRKVVTFLSRHSEACGIPAPVWHELWYGCQRLPPGRRHDALMEWLDDLRSRMPVFPYDLEAATWHSNERARLDAAGRAPPATDGAIASIAATRGLILVTGDSSGFVGFTGLELLNWRVDRLPAT